MKSATRVLIHYVGMLRASTDAERAIGVTFLALWACGTLLRANVRVEPDAILVYFRDNTTLRFER